MVGEIKDNFMEEVRHALVFAWQFELDWYRLMGGSCW